MRPIIVAVTLLASTSALCSAHDGPPGHDHSHDGHNHAPAANTPKAESAPKADTERKPTGKATDYFWERSDVAFHAGNYKRVLELQKTIISLDPQDIESYAVYAWVTWSMDDHKESLACIDRGLKANPDNWEMWKVAGEQYQFMKLWSKAREAYEKAVGMAPKDEDTQLMRRQLAHTAQNAGELKFSAETWRGLVKDYPNEAVNKNNLERVEKLISEQAKPGANTAQLSTGRFLLTSAGLLGALVIGPALYAVRSGNRVA